MDDWQTVRWTEAAQIASFMDLEAAQRPADGEAPATYFATLRAQGRTDDALDFLGLALPRLEALHWASTILADAASHRRLPVPDRQALDQSLRWLQAPNDAFRRAAYRAGQAAGPRSPERVLTLAVFFSGGSISEPDLPAILPAPDLTGRYAAGAVRMAACRDAHPDDVRQRALDLGAKVAAHGIEVLQPL